MDENILDLEALQKENKLLKEKNEKLYKDCVSFAKKIKASENSNARIEELEAEVDSLKAEIASLASSDRIREYLGADDDALEDKPFVLENSAIDEPEPAPVYEDIAPAPVPAEEEQAYAGEQVFPSSFPYAKYDDPDSEEQPIPKNHATHKNSPIRTFVRTFLWIFFVIAILVGIVSLVSYLFSTTFEDYSIANMRFASVYNSSLSPDYTKNDVILIKYSDFNGIELGSPVVTTKNTRSLATLSSVDVIDGENIATVKDKNGTYTVNEDQFYGKVIFKIPFVGQVVQYASANQYNYLAIVAASNLVLLALLLLIPSNKAKAPKFGKDYTVEDFTI